MSSAPCEPNVEAAWRISPLWIVLYLPVHQFVAQTASCSNAFLYLRLAFLALVALVLFIRKETVQLSAIFIGRRPRGRRDWIAAGAFLGAVLTVRIILSLLFHFTMPPFTAAAYAMIAIIPPINEEIVFCGLFLGALLAYAPRHPWWGVFISTAIFVSCHDLVGSHYDTWIALSMQSVIYGACYVRTRFVPLCMVCHWLWNSLLWFTGHISLV